MESSSLTLEHNVDCLRNELDRITDQETRLAKNKQLVLNQLLKVRRQITEKDRFPEYEAKRAQIIKDFAE